MKEVEITVDIYGVWQHEPPAYRIYIDEEMICEHNFLATESEFCREKILVNLDSGIDHCFLFEHLPLAGHPQILNYKNLKLNGNPIRPTFTVPN